MKLGLFFTSVEVSQFRARFVNLYVQLKSCCAWLLFLSFGPGLSPAAACRPDPGPSQCGEAHHPAGEEPATAAVWPERLRVSVDHPGK